MIRFVATPDRRELLTELTRDGFRLRVTFRAEEDGLIRCLMGALPGQDPNQPPVLVRVVTWLTGFNLLSPCFPAVTNNQVSNPLI